MRATLLLLVSLAMLFCNVQAAVQVMVPGRQAVKMTGSKHLKIRHSAVDLPFSEIDWKAYRNRDRMLFDLIKTQRLLGKKRNEVTQLLGGSFPSCFGADAYMLRFPKIIDSTDSYREPVDCLLVYYKRDAVSGFALQPVLYPKGVMPEGMPIPDAN